MPGVANYEREAGPLRWRCPKHGVLVDPQNEAAENPFDQRAATLLHHVWGCHRVLELIAIEEDAA